MSQNLLPQSPLASGLRYQALAQALVDDISSGRYPVGGLLPTEFELVELYGVSRHTVREAIRRLHDLGLVTRQPGVGTRVRAQAPAARYVHSSEGIGDLFQYVREVNLTLTEKTEVIADDELAEFLECRPGQAWLRVRGRRHFLGEALPIALAEVYIAWPYRGVLDGVEAPSLPLYVMIEQAHGCRAVEVRQQVSAVLLDAEAAEAFGTKPGEAGLRVVRKYRTAGNELFEAAVNLHPGDRFSQSMTLRLEAPASSRIERQG